MLAIVVAGPHADLVLGTPSQPIHRISGGLRIGIAPAGGVAVLVRQKVLVGWSPDHPVVAGSLAGRIPRDGQLPLIGAGEA